MFFETRPFAGVPIFVFQGAMAQDCVEDDQYEIIGGVVFTLGYIFGPGLKSGLLEECVLRGSRN